MKTPDFKPILFNTEMVKAILEGRKTQTRRLVKQPPVYGDILHDDKGWYYEDGTRNGHSLIPPYDKGCILWVRETWLTDDGEYHYKADDECPFGWYRSFWKPSIHMPKEAARIFLRVNNVRVERLKDIQEKYEPGPDNPVVKEGFGYLFDFIAMWDRTIKHIDRDHYGWDANPWVWVIEFERCKMPEGWDEL